MNTLSTGVSLPFPAAAEAGLSATRPRRRSRSLAHELVEDFSARIRSGELQPGDRLPTESELVRSCGVSRTVVREAISRLQAAGLVDTQHGVGSFVLAPSVHGGFYLAPGEVETAIDVLAVLELRISLETEAAGLAASRRTPSEVEAMRQVLDLFGQRVQEGGDTVAPDIDFHLCIAQATRNPYFVDVMRQLGATLLPRTRINTARLEPADQKAYLLRINQEHEQIFDAIARGDGEGARAAMRLHLGNGRERQRRALEVVQSQVVPSAT